VIVLEQSIQEAVSSELRVKTLKLKNQTAQLENLLRKKEALEIEISRLRKTIKLTRSNTQKVVGKQLSEATIPVESLGSEGISLNLDEVDPDQASEISALCEEFTSAEKSYLMLEELFSSTT
jgi:ribosome maturation protein Sdo1